MKFTYGLHICRRLKSRPWPRDWMMSKHWLHSRTSWVTGLQNKQAFEKLALCRRLSMKSSTSNVISALVWSRIACSAMILRSMMGCTRFVMRSLIYPKSINSLAAAITSERDRSISTPNAKSLLRSDNQSRALRMTWAGTLIALIQWIFGSHSSLKLLFSSLDWSNRCS